MATETCVIYALHLGDGAYRYVGLTRLGAEARLHQHRKNARQGRLDWPVYRWMRKHGPEAVQIEVLEVVAAPQQLDAREAAWISKLTQEGCDLLNCTAGGGGMRVVSDEVRAKLGHWTGRRYTAEERAAMSGSNASFFGRKHTSETRAKMRANSGPKRPEVAAKIRAAKLGVPRPEEVVRRMRETKASRPTEPGNHIRWHIQRDQWADDCEFCQVEVA